ncbi:MAG: hypothetical protein PHO09_08105 [Sphaerochaeta sp.]|nr:hypothetical protein [Sphaerochaeta sp.]
MNNLDWYTKVVSFCKNVSSCDQCPFFLLELEQTDLIPDKRICFTSKEALEHLSSWLNEGNEMEADEEEIEDNQWLKELIKGQFADEDDDDDFFMDDDFI